MSRRARALATARYDWDDFVALDEDDLRELIDGDLMEVEVPTLRHERAVRVLCVYLSKWAESHGGEALPSGYKVRIRKDRGVMPDVQFIRAEHLHRLDDEGLTRGAPDLAVEIVSASSRSFDRVTKLAWYASVGVPEYWLVDPEAQTLERLVLQKDRYVIREALKGAALFRPDSFVGLEISLRVLFSGGAVGSRASVPAVSERGQGGRLPRRRK